MVKVETLYSTELVAMVHWIYLANFLVVITWGWPTSATRVQSSTSSEKGVLQYLTRFGVRHGRDFFVYGTVTRNPYQRIGYNSAMVLALLPQQAWDDVYNSFKHSADCEGFFKNPLGMSWLHNTSQCNGNSPKKSIDYLRIVPCQHTGENFTLCNQPPDMEVFDGYDFTYQVSSVPHSEFYYLAFLTCSRAANCSWVKSDAIAVHYNIHLVNDRPYESNPYTNEFPYDLNGVLSYQLFFMICYLLLILIHFLLHFKSLRKGISKMHVLVRLFSVSLILATLFVSLQLIHTSVYAGNGKGLFIFHYLGEVCNQFSDWLLILVVILVGKGWQVTTSSLRWSKVTMLIWGAYIFFSGIFFIWIIVSSKKRIHIIMYVCIYIYICI